MNFMTSRGILANYAALRGRPDLKAALRQAVKNNRGGARVIVHPNAHADEYVKKPRYLFGIPDVHGDEVVKYLYRQCFHELMSKKYGSYIASLEAALRNSDQFSVVLAVNPEKTEKWLKGFGASGTILILPTIGTEEDKDRDPTPKFSEKNENMNTWTHFARFLKAFGVRRIKLAGEWAYTNSDATNGFIVGSRDNGCIPIAKAGLSEHFKVTVSRSLTFPNMELGSEYLEQYLVDRYFDRVNFYDGMIDLKRKLMSILPHSRT